MIDQVSTFFTNAAAMSFGIGVVGIAGGAMM